MQTQLTLGLVVSLLLTASSSHAEVTSKATKQKLQNSAQVAVEFDDNVFKTFRTSENDGLLRLLVKSRKKFSLFKSPSEVALQLGGKKYFTLPEQDTFIGQGDFKWLKFFSNRATFGIDLNLKGRLENNSTDAALTDINEDFISHTSRLHLSYDLRKTLRNTIYTKITYFTFFGDLAIDFVEERFGTRFKQKITDSLSASVGYEFSLSQFTNSPAGDRDDTQHEISTRLSYLGPLFLSVNYAYQDNDSSQNFFSSTAHKVSLLMTVAFHSSRAAKERGPEDVALILLGNLQIRQFPAVFVSDAEGRRLLFSGAEENNFNTLSVKLTKRLTKIFTLEVKYSRESNEFSDREDPFSRNRYLLGMRAAF